MELVLQLQHITKAFPGVIALDDVSLDIAKGEVHALCGENGAGKSTLMNILSGNLQPDGGTIILKGEKVIIPNPNTARSMGIGMVHQERSLVSELSIAENIFANTQPINRWGLIDYGALYRQTRQLLSQLQLDTLKPRTRVANIPPAEQQMVEIAKALALEPDVLILDEPTAAITEKETEILFQIIRSLTAQGTSVIYISHRMAEIFEIADRVSVLKDGKLQGTKQVEETDVNEIIRMMVGRDLKPQPYEDTRQEAVALQVSQFSGIKFQDISFELHQGEILGLAGLVGAGRTEIARAIIGADPTYGGEVWVNGNLCHFKHPEEAFAHKVVYLPEHRKTQGLFLEMSVADNIAVTHLEELLKGLFIQQAYLHQSADAYIKLLDIRTPTHTQKVVNLSGGNQQKIVLAKCLALKPHVLIVDEPTHGIDVGAKSEIYRLLRELAAQGMGILLISSELPELLTLSDRVLVLYNGQITAELPREQFSEETILHYASGTMNMYI